MAQFHICVAATGSMRQRNGAAPGARSPEAARRGTTWDHRAADLCMNHVLAAPRQTEQTLTEETFGQEDILFFVTLEERVSGDGRGPLQSDYIF